MSGEGRGQHDLYDQREHGFVEHEREMGYDREQKGYLAGGAGGEGAPRVVDHLCLGWLRKPQPPHCPEKVLGSAHNCPV